MRQTAPESLAELALEIDGIGFDQLERVVATRAFRRVTTVVCLSGGGLDGVGEDVALAEADHEALPPAGALAGLRGSHALGEWLDRLDPDALWSAAPSGDLARRQRRWAFESAALDLALRQAGRSLADVLGREVRPVRFVASFRLGEPPSIEPLRRRLDPYPALRLKLDPTSDWSDELMAEVAATGAVDVIDLKGSYRGTMVDQPPDRGLYERALAAFPDAFVEDPALTPETEQVLAGHLGRVAWDAPVVSAADLARLPVRPAAVNVKPARIGGIAELLALYAACAEEGIALYGGGSFELGPGRRQIQTLASIFHPDGPNDVAPAGYNEPTPPPGLPDSPLEVPSVAGFGAG